MILVRVAGHNVNGTRSQRASSIGSRQYWFRCYQKERNLTPTPLKINRTSDICMLIIKACLAVVDENQKFQKTVASD